MAEIDLNAKYGNTSPVKECAAHYGIPYEVALHITDVYIRGTRGGEFERQALRDWGNLDHMRDYPELSSDLMEIARRVVPARVLL